jgi:hypothetical protein
MSQEQREHKRTARRNFCFAAVIMDYGILLPDGEERELVAFPPLCSRWLQIPLPVLPSPADFETNGNGQEATLPRNCLQIATVFGEIPAV